MYPVSLPIPAIIRIVAVVLATLAANPPAVLGQASANGFYKAYYLEHARGDDAAAAELYAQAVRDLSLPADLQADAKHRLAVCREELATADFTRLMPPEPLAYIEINRPGERLRKLIDQLGLLADADGVQPGGKNRVAISPAVIDAVLGVRGLAVAVTGFNPATQQPSGVAILHPGNVELIRGLIETALPVQADIVDPIGGYATYMVEDVYVTLTKRLVIAGSSTVEIADVIERMKDGGEQSLATNPELAELLKERDGALLYFCVNPKPLMPLINMMTGGAGQCREMALAQALLDIQSFEALAGRFDISDEGLLIELTLRLAEGHRNLVYNFLRRPALDPETLRCVPAGAAGVFAMAMNDTSTTYRNPALSADADRPVVTALDLGRELFANINGIAVYAMPPTDSAQRSDKDVPDIAAVITVNDPAQSQALWYQLLGIASLASGASTMEGQVYEVAGVPVHSYRFEDAVTIHVGIMDNNLFIATSKDVLGRSIATKQGGKSILDDAAFAPPLKQLGPHTTLAVLAHPGRCMEIAKPFMSPGDVAEMEPVVALMKDTTASLAVQHSDRMLRLSATVSGVPDISSLVSDMLTKERQHGQSQRQLAAAVREKDWNGALSLLDEKLAEKPAERQALQKKFDVLAVHKGDHAAAAALGDELYAAMSDDAGSLNNFAWALLTDERYQHKYTDLALRLARRSNELTEHKTWAYLDTLALAEFEAGNTEAAVGLEEQAITLCKKSGGGGVEELEQALKRFRGGGEGKEY